MWVIFRRPSCDIRVEHRERAHKITLAINILAIDGPEKDKVDPIQFDYTSHSGKKEYIVLSDPVLSVALFDV